MSSFDLETAIATWRHALALRRAFLKEDLDELERHLRDHTAELVSNGNNLETAFREASTMLGDFEEGEIEYRKVLMTKLWRHHAIADEARWRIALFANYFKIARRHLWAHRMYTSIMIVGLAIGLATCLIIALFVRHELSYDRHFSTANRVYRLHQTELASSIMGLAGTIENRFPEIEYATLVPRPWEYLLTYDDQKQYLEGVLRVDSTFLTVFPFKVVRGQGEQALHAPGRMLVTESTAKRLFGDEDPIGKTIWVETSEPCQIVGILADPPSNTHFSFNALLSLHEAGRKQRYEEELKWTRFVGSFLYLLLREGTDANSVEARIHDFEVASRAGEPEGAREAQLHLQPLTDIHLYASALNQDIAPQGDIENVYLFAVIGILILLIACVNYVNLATARSVGRAKEIGVRKVVGADRHRLIIQFLSESTLMACLAWPLTLVLAVCALPFINSVTGQSLPLLIAHDPVLLLQTAGITLVLGIFSGLYPAVALTQPKPAVVLVSRGRTPARRGKWVRRTLVVLQFSVASALVAVAMAIGNQLEYIRTKQLGYIPEHLISFNLDPAIVDHYDAFAAKLASLPAVVSATRGVPPGIGWRSMMVELADPESGERWPIDFIEGDHAYLETLGITLLQGRTFDPDRDDGHTVLLSRSTVERLGLQENPLGRYLPIKALKNLK
ncbi:MAG: ABC transporter permease [Rhodothermales bacterium]